MPPAGRRGFTLVEMSVVIVLSALVLGMLVTLLVSLIQFHKITTERALARREIDRLTDTLRRDLGMSVSVTTAEREGRPTLILEGEDGQLAEYVLVGERCRWTGTPAWWPDTTPRDSFAIGPAEAWRVEQGGGATVSIVMKPRREHESRPPPIRVVAAALR